MAQKYKKQTQHDKVEAARAEEYRRLRAEKRKRVVVTVFSVLICVLLIFAFCFPAVTMLIN